MPLKRKRGRPSQHRPKIDQGTPELQRKRSQALTDEPIDLCLKRGLIEESEHRAARRLVWLYRLRNGKPWVGALDPDTSSGGSPLDISDDNWQATREKDLQEALSLLDQTRTSSIVLDVCVFQKTPGFLTAQPSGPLTLESREREYNGLRYGLGTLSRHWKNTQQSARH